MALFTRAKDRLPTPAEALPGRTQKMPVAASHFVLGTPLQPPFPSHLQVFLVGMGCFWGAEQVFWQVEGVFTTAVGYSGGYTPNPTYEEVCSGLTGHNEVVLVAFDPSVSDLERMLALFWENHDPTQGMRQGNDFGTQYRSGVYTSDGSQQSAAQRTKLRYEKALSASGYGPVTTEIVPAGEFYYAEDYHQQYLAKNPSGYCGLGGTGVSLPAASAAPYLPAEPTLPAPPAAPSTLPAP